MNISCAICAELFVNSDGSNINVTPCGHIFHGPCLLQWIERSKTCPECRHKTTFHSIIRAYFNVTHTNDDSRPENNVDQQQQIDTLKYQMVEKGVEMKKKTEEINSLTAEMTKIKSTLQLSRKTIIGLEKKDEQNQILHKANCDQIKNLTSRVKELDNLQKELTETREQLNLLDGIKRIMTGNQKDAEELINQNITQKSLAVIAAALKRELRASEAKRNELRADKKKLVAEIQHLIAEKNKLKEDYAFLESKLYQFESAGKENQTAKSDEMPYNSISENTEASTSTAGSFLNGPSSTISPPSSENRATRIIKLNQPKEHSPYIKSSSIAGLAPLIKRSESLSSKLKNSSSGSHNHEYSIFKKPRLASFNPKAIMKK